MKRKQTNLSLQWNSHRIVASRDILPVKTDRQQAESLVTVRATKHVSEIDALLLVREA